MQLSAALSLNAQGIAIGLGGVVLVSSDQDLNGAAISEGLRSKIPIPIHDLRDFSPISTEVEMISHTNPTR